MAAHLERLPLEEALQHEDGKRYASVVAVPLGSTTEGDSKVVDQWQVVDSSVVAVEPDTWLSRICKELGQRQRQLDAEARTWIVRPKPDFQRRCVAAEKYEAAKKHQLEFFSMMLGH